MIFQKYPSIEQSYREKFIEIIKETLELKNIPDEFAIMEKVHGANASFWYDGNEMKIARRKDFLTDKEIKSDWKGNEWNIKKKIKLLYNLIENDNPDLQKLVVFGERFGGNYPHPDVPKIQGMGMIQAGVFYSPDIHFYGFDIKVNEKFLSIEKANFYFDKVNIHRQKIMFVGTLDKCLEFSPIFSTRIPEYFDLPYIDGNEAEGIVIRSLEEMCYRHNRMILKNKNPKFIEREQRSKKPKKIIELSDYFQNIIENLSMYVNINRLNNVLSKLGTLTNKDFGKLMKEMIEDVKEDFEKDYPGILGNLEKKDLKLVMAPINKQISNLLKKEFLPKV